MVLFICSAGFLYYWNPPRDFVSFMSQLSSPGADVVFGL